MTWRVFELDETPYDTALAHQMRLHDWVRRGDIEGALVLLTHPPTVTMGRHAKPEHVLDADRLEARGWTLRQVDRGGDVTWHGPGQLVVYPIVSLERLGLSVRTLVCRLSDALRGTLAHHGITAHWEDENPGVWVGADKIAAVGLRIARRVSRHGISLNVNPALESYGAIVPCGLRTRGVTSMARVLGSAPPMCEVRQTMLDALLDAFDRPLCTRHSDIPDRLENLRVSSGSKDIPDIFE